MGFSRMELECRWALVDRRLSNSDINAFSGFWLVAQKNVGRWISSSKFTNLKFVDFRPSLKTSFEPRRLTYSPPARSVPGRKSEHEILCSSLTANSRTDVAKFRPRRLCSAYWVRCLSERVSELINGLLPLQLCCSSYFSPLCASYLSCNRVCWTTVESCAVSRPSLSTLPLSNTSLSTWMYMSTSSTRNNSAVPWKPWIERSQLTVALRSCQI
jgi:hypothetical protein